MSVLPTAKTQPTDEQLIERYLQGDEPALEALISRYLKPIYGFVHRCLAGSPEAADIAQETFIKAWRSLRRFDQTKKFKPWLYRIARNASLDHLKKNKIIPFAALEDDHGMQPGETIPDDRPLPDEIFEDSLSAQAVGSALGELAHEQRAVLVLRAESGLTFEEMSETLNEPLNTVKSRYRRALQALKKKLKPE